MLHPVGSRKLSGVGPAEWLIANARQRPDAPCLIDAAGTRSYATVADEVERLATALAVRGLRRGDRIAIMATDSIEYAELLLASMRLRTSVVPLNFRLADTEIANVLTFTKPSVLCVDRRYHDLVETSRRADPELRFVLGVDGSLASGESSIAEVIANAPPVVEATPATDDEEILVLAMTSGTTASPKIVMQSQRMLKAMAVQKLIDMRFERDDVSYCGAPLFHMAGLSNVLLTISRGAASLLLPQFEAEVVLSWMQSGRVTRCLFMPTMITALLRQPGVRDGGYDALRSITYGGAPMPVSLIRDVAEVFGCGLFNGFGAGTEAGSQTVFTPADHDRAFAGREELLGSIGRPVFGVDLELRGPSGERVDDGQIGEIFTRSDTLMSGYLDRPDLTAAAVQDGWFRSGDMAFRDSEGYLHLAGRSDDMIIRGGENIYPAEIENAIASLQGVSEVAVVGVPDPDWGEVVVAIVVPARDRLVDAAAVAAHCRGRIASYKIPARTIVVSDLPKNSTGKVLKRELRERLVVGELG